MALGVNVTQKRTWHHAGLLSTFLSGPQNVRAHWVQKERTISCGLSLLSNKTYAAPGNDDTSLVIGGGNKEYLAY